MTPEAMRSLSPSSALEMLFDIKDGLQPDYEAMAELIKAHERFLVVSHVGPDGDAIGSTLGLRHLLKQMGKSVVSFNVDPVPFNLRFLPDAAQVIDGLGEGEGFDVTLVVDCPEPSRVGGDRFPSRGWGSHLAIIDHHIYNGEALAATCVRDVSAAAVGEMIVRLALTLAEPVSAEIAECSYTALMTDTGGFRYSKTTPQTFQIASYLVAHGAEPWKINSNTYENQPLARMKLLARVLDTLSVSDCGRLAFVRVDTEMLEQTGTGSNMLDGFINYARSVQGVEVATQLREVEQGRYKISFRSSGRVNVARLAEAFGGGGHHNAAGCVIDGEATIIQRRLTERLSALL